MKKETKTELSFSAAFEELSKIAIELENNDLAIETMAEKLSRASFLANYCKEKLREIEDKVEAELDKDDHVS